MEVVALRSEEHTSELQSLTNLVCRLLLEKKKKTNERDNDFRRKSDVADGTLNNQATQQGEGKERDARKNTTGSYQSGQYGAGQTEHHPHHRLTLLYLLADLFRVLPCSHSLLPHHRCHAVSSYLLTPPCPPYPLFRLSPLFILFAFFFFFFNSPAPPKVLPFSPPRRLSD